MSNFEKGSVCQWLSGFKTFPILGLVSFFEWHINLRVLSTAKAIPVREE